MIDLAARQRVERMDRLRHNVRGDFSNISTGDLQQVLRCFSNIKNLIAKDEDALNHHLIRNKGMVLKNVLHDKYVVSRLRKEVDQDLHPRINSLLLINRVIGMDDNTPFCTKFFRGMMRSC